MQAELKEMFGVTAALERGSGGVFVVTVDGRPVFDKVLARRFPRPGEVAELVRGLGKRAIARADSRSAGVVLYASRYGSTKEYSSLIGGALGFTALEVGPGAMESIRGATFVVVGSPIYAFGVLPDMERFLSANGHLLQGRVKGAFVVCGDTLWNPRAGEGGGRNLGKLLRLLPETPPATAVLPGRMLMESLGDDDRRLIQDFYRRLGREATGFDRFDPRVAAAFAGELSGVLGGSIPGDSATHFSGEGS